MNERGKPGENLWRRPGRQMPDRGSGGGDASASDYKEIHEKKLGGETLPERRTLRGTEVSGTTLEQRHPDWPKITVKFYLSSHGTAEDMKGLVSSMGDADIYLHEQVGDSSRTTGLYQKVSDRNLRGSETVEEVLEKINTIYAIRDRTSESICHALLDGRNRIIDNIDLSGEPDEDNLLSHEGADTRVIDKSYYLPGFESSKPAFLAHADFQRKREAILAKRIEPLVARLLKEKKALREKEELIILFSMGVYHTTLPELVAEEGITVSRDFPYKPYVYDSETQVLRAVHHGIEPDTDLLAKAHLEFMMKKVLDQSMEESTKSSDTKASYLRKVSSHFTTEEIQEIHNNWIASGFSVDPIILALQNKGIDELPHTNEELLAALTHIEKSEKEASEARLPERLRS